MECEHCGAKKIIDAPPFEEMTDEDKEAWRNSKGQIVELCPNGCQ